MEAQIQITFFSEKLSQIFSVLHFVQFKGQKSKTLNFEMTHKILGIGQSMINNFLLCYMCIFINLWGVAVLELDRLWL